MSRLVKERPALGPAFVAGLAEGHRPSAPGPGEVPMRTQRVARTPSVAVLPFVSLTAVAALDSEGVVMAANLATLFRSDPWRVVVPSVGTHIASGADLHVTHLGRWLNADLILMGRLRRQGDTVETCVQLIDSMTGLTRWCGRCASCAGAALPESSIAVRVAKEIRQALGNCWRTDL